MSLGTLFFLCVFLFALFTLTCELWALFLKLDPFHTGNQFGTTVELRPDDCIDLNCAFHTYSSRSLMFGHTTQILVASHCIWSYDQFDRTTAWLKAKEWTFLHYTTNFMRLQAVQTAEVLSFL